MNRIVTDDLTETQRRQRNVLSVEILDRHYNISLIQPPLAYCSLNRFVTPVFPRISGTY